MTEAVELEPCPFCGGPAEIIEADEAGDCAYAVQCQTRGCEASSRVYFALKDDVTEQLAAAWNRRAKPPEGEPVAWRRRGKNLRWEYLDDGSSSVVVSEWAPLYTRPVACPDRPALDVPALQREVAGIIVRDVLQEDFDDLVEGYLDEIMRASLRIIRLPGYSVVARAFETNLADALLSASDGAGTEGGVR